jgi:drug/metabolite transporter (DMT)-like permease
VGQAVSTTEWGLGKRRERELHPLILQAGALCLLALEAGEYHQKHELKEAPMIIYTACLTLGLLFAIFSAFAGHLFGGHDGGDIGTGGHAEAGYDHSGVPGISFFSPTVLGCFITAFGACGLILTHIESTRSVWVSAPVSAVAGAIMAFISLAIFNWMFSKTQSSSESRVSSLMGQAASIVTPIPANGVGEIAYVQGGSRYTAPARTETGAAVPAGKPVRITRVVGTQYFVEVVN